MSSTVQRFATEKNLSFDDFMGEMRKRGCSEATAIKIWNGTYEDFESFTDNDVSLSNIRKAADIFKVKTGFLIPK